MVNVNNDKIIDTVDQCVKVVQQIPLIPIEKEECCRELALGVGGGGEECFRSPDYS